MNGTWRALGGKPQKVIKILDFWVSNAVTCITDLYLSIMKATNPGLIKSVRSIPRRLVIVFDAIAIVAAFLFTYYLRFSFNPDSFILVVALKQSLLALLVYLAFEAIFRSFAGFSNRTTIPDIVRVLISTTCSLALLMLITSLSSQLAWQPDMINIPRSILVLHYTSVLILLSIFRILFRASITISPRSEENRYA